MTYGNRQAVGSPATAGVPTTTGLQEISVSAPVVHVKSAWYELEASTDLDATEITVSAHGGSIPQFGILVDIAVGAIGSEVVVIENLCFGRRAINAGGETYNLAASIPKGSRISVRLQASSAGTVSLKLGMFLFGGPYKGHSKTYGADLSISNGTLVRSGTPSGTKGSWIEFCASTEGQVVDLRFMFQPGSNSSLTTSTFLVDIAVGPIGSEIVLCADIPLSASSSVDIFQPSIVYLPCSIAKGERISVRSASSIGNVYDDYKYVIMYARTM